MRICVWMLLLPVWILAGCMTTPQTSQNPTSTPSPVTVTPRNNPKEIANISTPDPTFSPNEQIDERAVDPISVSQSGSTPASTTRQPGIQKEACPITPILPDFWDKAGPVAGDFPIWITSRGQSRYSQLGPKVLPSASSELQFEEGRTTKDLIFVDKNVQGDLVVSGHQLDGNSLVYFPQDEEITRLDATTLQLLSIPANIYTIPAAHRTNKLPEPPGKAVQGMGSVYITPGCYEFIATIGEYTVRIVKEIVDD